MSKYNNRCHMLLLYPDNEEHVKAYEHIEKVMIMLVYYMIKM